MLEIIVNGSRYIPVFDGKMTNTYSETGSEKAYCLISGTTKAELEEALKKIRDIGGGKWTLIVEGRQT